MAYIEKSDNDLYQKANETLSNLNQEISKAQIVLLKIKNKGLQWSLLGLFLLIITVLSFMDFSKIRSKFPILPLVTLLGLAISLSKVNYYTEIEKKIDIKLKLASEKYDLLANKIINNM